MDKDNLPQTKDFQIRIVSSAKALEVDCYGVYHIETDILNHKDTSITRAYEALTKMQEVYDIMLDDISKTDRANKARSNVIKLK